MTVLLSEDLDNVRILTLNRPKVRNAINGDLAEALDAALTEIDADPEIRVTVLTGTGTTFCGGADLKAITTESRRMILKDTGFAGLAHRSGRTTPLICAVEGHAYGGGFEICLAADMITAGADARFALVEVLRSRVAGGGGLLRLGRRLPSALAMEIALTGRAVEAQEAHELGLVNRVTRTGGALTAALELAKSVCAGAPLSVTASRRIIEASANAVADKEVWRITAEEWRRVRASDDSVEGTAAFLEKRPPQWTGR